MLKIHFLKIFFYENHFSNQKIVNSLVISFQICLIFLELMYVATDLVGTPRMILNSVGEIISQPLRTPFGALIEQPVKDDPASIPIGFQGGIEDPESGIVILEGNKPYDSQLGQWMIPRLEKVLDPNFVDPSSVFLYRFCNNDPINSEDLTRDFSYMDKLDDWLSLFGIDPPTKYLNNLGLPETANLFGRTEIESRFSFVTQRRRPKLFSGFLTEPQVFFGNLSLDLHRIENGSSNVEDPEFFHRKISATKLDDGSDNDVWFKLLDQVTFQLFDYYKLKNGYQGLI